MNEKFKDAHLIPFAKVSAVSIGALVVGAFLDGTWVLGEDRLLHSLVGLHVPRVPGGFLRCIRRIPEVTFDALKLFTSIIDFTNRHSSQEGTFLPICFVNLVLVLFSELTLRARWTIIPVLRYGRQLRGQIKFLHSRCWWQRSSSCSLEISSRFRIWTIDTVDLLCLVQCGSVQ